MGAQDHQVPGYLAANGPIKNQDQENKEKENKEKKNNRKFRPMRSENE